MSIITDNLNKEPYLLNWGLDDEKQENISEIIRRKNSKEEKNVFKFDSEIGGSSDIFEIRV